MWFVDDCMWFVMNVFGSSSRTGPSWDAWVATTSMRLFVFGNILFILMYQMGIFFVRTAMSDLRDLESAVFFKFGLLKRFSMFAMLNKLMSSG